MAASTAPILQAMGEMDRRIMGNRQKRPGVFLRLIELDKRSSKWNVVAELLTSEEPPTGIHLTGTVTLSPKGNRSQWHERPLSRSRANGLAESLARPRGLARRVPKDASGLHLLELLAALARDPLVQMDADDRVALVTEIEAAALEFVRRKIISVSRAAELAQMPFGDLRKLIIPRTGGIGFGPETLKDLRTELEGAGVVLGTKEFGEE